MNVPLRTAGDIAAIAAAGQVAAEALQAAAAAARPGVSCLELDAVAGEVIRSRGAEPTFVGYHGFPAAICACPNSVVAHGIPGDYLLEEGDIIGIDVAATLDGWIADTAATFAVGQVDDKARQLLAATELTLQAALAEIRPGASVGTLSRTIAEHAHLYGYAPVRDLAGHAVGRQLHEGEMLIPNFFDGERETLQEGMVFAVEPMLNSGGSALLLEDDGWTLVTRDGSLSACFEHTVAVTSEGVRVLTVQPEKEPR